MATSFKALAQSIRAGRPDSYKGLYFTPVQVCTSPLTLTKGDPFTRETAVRIGIRNRHYMEQHTRDLAPGMLAYLLHYAGHAVGTVSAPTDLRPFGEVELIGRTTALLPYTSERVHSALLGAMASLAHSNTVNDTWQER